MLPGDFLERMQRMLGDEFGAFLEAFEGERFQGLRLNPLKIGRDGRSALEWFGDGRSALAWAASGEDGLDGEGNGFAHLRKVPWAADGFYYASLDQPGKHPYHEAGVYYIQEPSAMAPVELLDVRPGERVLDLCAAPGGKSVQIGAKLRGRGLLVSNEIHPARAKILSENVERMGICNACVTNETPERLAELFAGFFDRILVDAPCSGEGMFRKNQEACAEWSLENVRLCAQRQDRILDCAAGMLRPGGRLVYSTCTFAPEEDEGSVGRFLRRHGEFRILPVDKRMAGLEGCDGMPGYADGPVAGLENTMRLWPQRIKGEGHFAAVLQKEGEMPEEYRYYVAKNTTERAAMDMEKAFEAFCKENLRFGGGGSKDGEEDGQKQKAGEEDGRKQDSGEEDGRKQNSGEEDRKKQNLTAEMGGRYLAFGDNLYLAPPDMPSLKGLKVLRPGLHLGQVKKNRFEPAHALALALAPGDAVHVWNLDSDNPAALAYLNGQTFSAQGEKGWYLICVDGFSMGWGKLAGGIMKNHYPKGLRR